MPAEQLGHKGDLEAQGCRGSRERAACAGQARPVVPGGRLLTCRSVRAAPGRVQARLPWSHPA